MIAMNVTQLNHTAIPVADLERSRRFYQQVLGLRPIPRPPFDFPGAWFALGDGPELHLICRDTWAGPPSWNAQGVGNWWKQLPAAGKAWVIVGLATGTVIAAAAFGGNQDPPASGF